MSQIGFVKFCISVEFPEVSNCIIFMEEDILSLRK